MRKNVKKGQKRSKPGSGVVTKYRVIRAGFDVACSGTDGKFGFGDELFKAVFGVFWGFWAKWTLLGLFWTFFFNFGVFSCFL